MAFRGNESARTKIVVEGKLRKEFHRSRGAKFRTTLTGIARIKLIILATIVK